MANSTRSGNKIVEENSKGRRSSGGGSDTSLTIAAESYGLRRSARDTSCKKSITPEKFVSRQSWQIDKQKPTPPVTRSLAKKLTTSIPLRRSKRSNKQSPSSKSSGSKAEISCRSPELHYKKRKDKRREKPLKQSTFGTMDAKESENENDESDYPRVKRIRMTTRAYKALFQKQEKKVNVSGKCEGLASPSKSPAKDGSNSGGCMSKEGAPAVESGNVAADNSLPGKETAENLCEEQYTRISQKNNSAGQVVIRDTNNVDDSVNHEIHNLPLLSYPELIASDRSDDGRTVDISPVVELPGVLDSSTKERAIDVDVYKNRVIEEPADATGMTVCKYNTSVASPPSNQENQVDESTAVNMSRKSGEPEDGVDLRPDENNVHMSAQTLEIQGHDADADVEQLPRCSSFGCKAVSFRFVEYWVPVQLSHVQLEKYCSILLSSSLTLRSSLKSDPFGALHDTLADIRKCCDHPYLLDNGQDNSLQSFLTSGLQPIEMLDIGIQASGKLELLDKFLMELRSRGKRALILFQSISSFGKDPKSPGDILDDMMRQRFGVDSYERIDVGLVRSKIQTGLNNFNNQELGRFVFLLEARACHSRSSIKLSSVDVVIIFGSDLNPANDIRTLQKLTFEPESEKIKVLRLYSCFTVEEKVLINTKQGISMDGRLEDINLSLMWGASYLFDKLKEFQGSNSESSKLIISDPLHANNVMKDFLSLLSVVKENNFRNSSMILRVQQNAGVYSTECPLVGESKNHLSTKKLPHIFWGNLLEGIYPSWRYLTSSGPRNRKRAQNSSCLNEKQMGNSDEAGTKRTKLASDNGVQSSRKQGKEEEKMANTNSDKKASGTRTSRSFHPPPSGNDSSNSMAECDEARKLRKAQRSLLCILQPEVSKLCEVLKLMDDAKKKADIFLDYVVSNHRVDREPATILQAFQLALCWTAASLSKVKVDHKESFVLAKDRLNYSCEWDQADYVYKMMRCLKEMFLKQRRSLEAEAADRAPSSNLSHSSALQIDVEDMPSSQDNSSKGDVRDSNKLVAKKIKKIKKKWRKCLANLLLVQEKEKNKICCTYEQAKANLDKQHLIEAAVIRSLHGEGPTRIDKLNVSESQYNRKSEELKNQMVSILGEIELAHIAARTELQLKEASEIKSFREWAQTELLKKPAEPEAPDAAVSSSCENPSNPVRRFRLSSKSNEVSLLVPIVTGLDHHVAACRLDQDREDVSSIRDGTTSSVPGDEIPLDEHRTTSSVSALENAVQVNLLPQERDIPSETSFPTTREGPPDRETISAVPDNVVLIDPQSEYMRIDPLFSTSAPENAEQVNLLPQERVIPSETSSLPTREGPPDTETVSSVADDVVPIDPEFSASALENAEQVNLLPQERGIDSETSSLPTRKGPQASEALSGVPDHVVPRDPQSEDMQTDPQSEGTVAYEGEEAATGIGSTDHQAPQDLIGGSIRSTEDQIVAYANTRISDQEPVLAMSNNISPCTDDTMTSASENPTVSENQVLDRPISEAPQVHGVPNATSVDEQDISGNSNQQKSRPDTPGDSTLLQPVSISPQADSVLTILPKEPQNQCNLGSTPSRVQEGNTSSIDWLNAPAQVSNPPVSSSTDATQSDQATSNPAETDPTSDMQNTPNLTPVSSTAQPPSTDGHVPINVPESRQVPEASRPLTHAVQCASNANGGGHVTRFPENSTMSSVSGSSSRSIQPSFCMPSVNSDPLQSELDKIWKEIDHTTKNFEYMKRQLQVDCEREIEEAAAKIRQKYGVKLQETEAEFVSKKKELETNQNKVLMNKILAAAFRYKCMDVKLSGTPVTVKLDARSSLEVSVPRPVSSTLPSSNFRPAAVVASATSNSQSTIPTTSTTVVSTRAPARSPPLVQPLHHSSLCPSSSSRPPPPTTGQFASPRLPAPHLQAASAASRPSPSLPPLPGYQRPPSSSSARLSHFPKPTLGRTAMAHRADQLAAAAAGSLGSSQSSQVSNLDWLPGITSRQLSTLQRLPPTDSNGPSLSEVRQLGGTADKANGSAIINAANIICLSDEE